MNHLVFCNKKKTKKRVTLEKQQQKDCLKNGYWRFYSLTVCLYGDCLIQSIVKVKH